MAADGARLTVAAPPPSAGDGVSGPFVAYFPSGVPEGIGGASAAAAAPRFRAFRRGAAGAPASQRQQLMLVGHTDVVDYVGTNFEGDAAAPAVCQYALGVVDAAAGSVTFLPLAGSRVLRLDASVRGLDYGAPAWQQDDAAETPAGRAAARKRLDDSFATEKRRRQQARLQTARTVAPEALPAMADMQEYIANRVKDEAGAAELAQRLTLARNIPPHRPDATCAADAYPLSLVCEPHLLDELPWRELMKACKSSKARAELEASTEPPPPPGYVLSRLALLAEPGDASEREALAKALAYLGLLLRLSAAPRELDDAFVASLALRPTVAAHLLGRFTESAQGAKRHSRTQKLRDLLTAHVLVLALIVENYSLDYTELAKALTTEPLKLVKAFSELGCKIKRAGGAPPRAVLMADAPPGATLASFLPDTRTRIKAKAKR